MGNKYLLDTYVVVQSINKGLELGKAKYFISDITKNELFSCENLSKDEKNLLEEILKKMTIIDTDEIVKKNSSIFEEKYELKDADAIISSVAYSYNLPLITNDLTFKDIEEIKTEPFYFQ